MFSTHKTLAAVVLSGLLAAGLVGNAAAQTNQNRPGVKELPQYKGTFPLPGQQFPSQPFPGQPLTGIRCDYSEIDRLARQLERNADRLHNVVDDRYQRTNTYRQLHNEVKELEFLADRIHLLADRKANPGFIQQELVKADRSARRVDALIDELARFRDMDRDSIRTLRRRLEDVNTTIDRLAREIRN